MKGLRAVMIGLALGLATATAPAATVKDIAGRTVTVPDNPKRVILGEGRLFYAMALLEGKSPFARIAGWQGDFRRLDPQTYALYRQRFPEIDRVPLIGNASEDTVSVEKMLSLRPDVAIFSVSGHGPGIKNPMVDTLTRAGVPVVFVDFRDKPLEHTAPSLRLMGKVLKREAQANAYLAFYDTHLARIRTRVAKLAPKDRPLVFMDVRAGSMDAVTSAGKGSVGEFVDIAGGRNLAAALLPSPLGQVNIETVLASRPALYLATGAGAPDAAAGVKLGAAVSAEQARASLIATGARDQLKGLEAGRNGRSFALWHHYYISPYHIAAIEAVAKWLHPERFADVDPNATLRDIHKRFLAIEPTGTYWVNSR
ncbi:ABC transporter substrate-binding protein [Paludibacterium paludis]|uniref:Iron ABC transporter substrate-binding protein n=1 Tax=Paludibacterium paludis TaxID=1225769 RepID=A0A918P5R2_9NEIS|nr:ABC transporter substrate-binding protein [Paludibacterium paludis]GGY22684.1 iron ABC transporter substrate-binding protein [Paludibacterium paludis]